MNLTPLTAISPIDGRYADKTAALRPYFSEFALMKYRLSAKIHWLLALSDEENISELPALADDDKQHLLSLIENFSEQDAEQIKTIEAKTHHDLKAVEYFLREQCKQHSKLASLTHFIHFACTSDDINNIAYALMLRDARQDILLPNMQNLISDIETLAHEHAKLPMLARTHGQAATPTTLGKEFRVFSERLKTQLNEFSDIKIKAKCNGATGNFNAHVIAYPDVDWIKLSKHLLNQLALSVNSHTTQIEPHDYIAELAHAMIRFNTILIDLSRDVWLYISQGYFAQIVSSDSIGSSTMPHKINPIDFENAEGNLGLSNAILTHFPSKLPISRLQRDLSDSTVLRNIGTALAHSLLAYQSLQKGLGKLQVNEQAIADELDDHWSVLTEAVQTVMRRYGHDDAYEQLKALSRGKPLDKTILHDFIKQTDLPDEAKQRLLDLTPATYIGLAVELGEHR
jgi:adenylosuccinate lyase